MYEDHNHPRNHSPGLLPLIGFNVSHLIVVDIHILEVVDSNDFPFRRPSY